VDECKPLIGGRRTGTMPGDAIANITDLADILATQWGLSRGGGGWRARARAATAEDLTVNDGRGLHSSTFQLNLS
jgi:hypothetical protein